MKKIIIFRLCLVCVVLFFTSAGAQNFKNTATAGFVFLELPVSARVAGLGEASIALSDVGAQGWFSNPASVGFSASGHSFTASYSPWLADTKHLAAGYSCSTTAGVFGLSANYLDYGEMTKTIRRLDQRVYEVIGTFRAGALAVGVGYSNLLTDKFSFGVSAKYVRETIDIYHASNMLFDGGVLYYTGFGSMRIAATIMNFGVNAKYRNDPFKMPAQLKLGIAGELFDGAIDQLKLTGILEAIHPNDNDERVNAGIEATYMNMLSVRAGYKFFYDEDSYTFGVGIVQQAYIPAGVDFSVSGYGRLGTILRFTIQAGI